MTISNKTWLAIAACVVLGSCADDTGVKIEQEPGPQGLPQVTQPEMPGAAVKPGGNVGPRQLNYTPEADIAWTDPDNPDAGIPEIEVLMAAPKRGPWEESETIARQTAAREGKPILIWFTNSTMSPSCKALSTELFGTQAFGKWAEKNVVRLRVDADTSVNDPSLTLGDKITRQVELKNYVHRLKKRYKVLGHPTLLMLNPSGEVLWKETGFKRGQADFVWGLIKQAVAVTDSQYKEWRKSLESKGYREWEGSNGRKVFAKLDRYFEGTLILIEPGGERYKTHESRLSRSDRKWITEQKVIRGIE
ncbi:MAG: thioredoxin family protein [Verrucomicrobiota bacterium]